MSGKTYAHFTNATGFRHLYGFFFFLNQGTVFEVRKLILLYTGISQIHNSSEKLAQKKVHYTSNALEFACHKREYLNLS